MASAELLVLPSVSRTMKKKEAVDHSDLTEVVRRAMAESKIAQRKYADFYRHQKLSFAEKLSNKAAPQRILKECYDGLSIHCDFVDECGIAYSTEQVQNEIELLFLEWHNKKNLMPREEFSTPPPVVDTPKSTSAMHEARRKSAQAKPTSAKKKGLKGLTAATKEYLENNKNRPFKMDDLERATGAKRRRILEVLHVMEGIGILERNHNVEHGLHCYEWISHCTASKEPKRIDLEEQRLDTWIDSLQQQNATFRQSSLSYVGADTLKRRLYKFDEKNTEAPLRKKVAIALSQDDTWDASGERHDFLCLEPRTLAIYAPAMHKWGLASAPEGFEMNGPDEPIRYHTLEESKRALRASTWCSDLLSVAQSPSLTCVSEDDEHCPDKVCLDSTEADPFQAEAEDKGLLPLLLHAISVRDK